MKFFIDTANVEDTLFPYTTLFRSSEERRVGKECMPFVKLITSSKQ